MSAYEQTKWFWLIFLISLLIRFLSATHFQLAHYPTSLLYSTTKDIRNCTFVKNRENLKLRGSIIVKNYTFISALDYHYEKQKICWSDPDIESIQCLNYNNTMAEHSVVEIAKNTLAPDGLSIDWFTSNIYWTENESNKIEVATLDGKYHKVLYWTDIDQPRAIIVVPMKGFLFWTDWGETPRIERASMNGDLKTRKVIVSKDIYWPNGITVDYNAEKVYWSDGKYLFIKVMNYDGSNLATILKSGLDYPYALTVFSTKLFWTDWKTLAIHYYDMNGTQNPSEIAITTRPMDIKVFDKSRQPLLSHKCETNNGGCSHLCLLAENEPYYSCACPMGIKLIDNQTCADGPQELLLLARRSDIYVVYLDSPDYSYRAIPLNNVKYSIAIDYDPIDNYIYWSDDEVKKIQRAHLDGSNQQDVISTDIENPDGIAIDWLSRNIYWADTGTDKIEVATLIGGYRKVVIGERLLDPRGIGVAPELGWLFWSDWNEKDTKIERSNLDGSERILIVYKDLGWPNGLTLDSENWKIYWCDAKSDKIEFANMDGTQRQTLISDNIPHPFGFSLMGDSLYWTDWQRRAIDRVDKTTGKYREVITEQMENVMGLKAIRLGESIGTNQCKINNGNCSQLCFHRYKKERFCGCQVDYDLTKDKRQCVKPNAVLLFSKKTSIGRISIENEPVENNLFIPNVKHASSIDFDTSSSRVYWSDNKLRAIMRAFINGSESQKVIDLGLASPEDIAIDRLGSNIYWTDPVSHRIEVSRLTGTSRRTLLWDEAYEPHSIALDPVSGYMYWSEWGQTNCIKKAAMNGSKQRSLISTNGKAIGLTLDYEKRRIYWAETDGINTNSAIWSADLDGNDKRIIVNHNIFHPVGLTLYKDYIYWGDEKTGHISRAHKTNGSSSAKILSLNENITDLSIFQLTNQNYSNQCAVNNGNCSHLCLALPEETVKYTCACPTHYILKHNECIPPASFMLYSLKNLVVRLLPDTSECPEAVLPVQGLKSVRAIEYDLKNNVIYWVDGKVHAIKSSNMGSMQFNTVVSSSHELKPFDIAIDTIGRLLFWTCSAQNVINITRLDNSNPFGSLKLREDEKPRLIVIHVAKRLLFYTDVGATPQLIRTRLDGSHRMVITKGGDITAIAVDTENDSIVWSQEHSIYISTIDGENKHVVVNESNSKITQLTVHAGWLYWIDKELNQFQRLELTTGKSRSILPIQASHIIDLISVKKLQNHNCNELRRCSHFCILNGTIPQCACPYGKILQEDKRVCQTIPNCGTDGFSCTISTSVDNRDCIPLSWKCDGQKDCSDGSDELDCPSCQTNQFRCHNGECIEKYLVCNKKSDCSDGSDEKNCCENSFQCPQTEVCLPLSIVCDGTENCADGSDERDCAEKSSNAKMIIALCGLTLVIIIVGCSLYCCHRKRCFPHDESSVDEVPESLTPLDPYASKLRKGIPDVVRMSILNDSRVPSYDRRHITGTSSTSNTTNIGGGGGASSTTTSGCYARAPLNPPPSPATTRTSSPSSRYRPYRHYKSINQPPPPTPNSTDICDESDYNYPLNRSRCEGSFPPPPTPRSHYHLESCPPSPSSRSSTYFSPFPPPPSPRDDSDS